MRVFFLNDTATTEIDTYGHTLALHDALPISQEQATARASQFAEATKASKVCGDATAVAKQIGAEVVDNDQVRVRDLPAQLQQLVLGMSVGEATPPFGTPTEGVRTLVLCGSDDPQSGQLPDPSQRSEEHTSETQSLMRN